MEVLSGQRLREQAVRAASRTLAEMLDRDARARALLEADGPLPDRLGYLEAVKESFASDGFTGLRIEKRRRWLEIAARDLCNETSLETAIQALSDLADACLEVALEGVEAPAGLAIVAMGKLGARELNYVSDIDVVFVTDDDPFRATKPAETLLRHLGHYAPEGRAFEIDTNLRPEGRSGALVRSLDGCLEYYQRWSQPWEHQALIKARPAAGNHAVAQALVDGTRDLVFPHQVSTDRIASIRKMKRRIEDHVARSARRSKGSEADDVKLGPGGIRDIEFSVQLLQLVHGGADEDIRERSTLGALEALAAGGYVAESDGESLSAAYRWLRTVEHRLQIQSERRVHHLPADEEGRTQIARLMGFTDSPSQGAAALFTDAHRVVLADVRNRFERLFYKPLIESLADGAERRLSGEALRDRLRVLNFRDVDRAARNLEALVAGTSRRAGLIRLLMPALLRWLASTPLPDEGLVSFWRLGEALGVRLEALGAMRDNPPGLALLAKVLGSGRLLGEVLMHVPEELHSIADPEGLSHTKDRDHLVREAEASLAWRDPAGRLDGLRRFKRREMLRVAVADVAGSKEVAAVGASLADLADACLEAALEGREIPFAVIGLGKLGGRELNYSSDIDVLFVHDGDPGEAEKIAERLLNAVGQVTPEGQAFRIDPALRPEGKSGPLVRSYDSYLEYYERWSKPWEHHALVKARWAAGDRELGDRLIRATHGLAFPERLSDAALGEIRHLKARMERERIPRGQDPRGHIKQGPGGLSDIEFGVQILQRQHGYAGEELHTTNTFDAVDAVRKLELVSQSDGQALSEAYRFLMRLRNRLFLMAGRPVDSLPTKPEELEALGIAMGYDDQPRQELQEAHLRVTRRARKVTERLIYG